MGALCRTHFPSNLGALSLLLQLLAMMTVTSLVPMVRHAFGFRMAVRLGVKHVMVLLVGPFHHSSALMARVQIHAMSCRPRSRTPSNLVPRRQFAVPRHHLLERLARQ